MILTFCSSGPYARVKDLLSNGANHWFPWGYNLSSVSPVALGKMERGAVAEFWEVDDIRSPCMAQFVAIVQFDFVRMHGDYVALTAFSRPGRPARPSREVIEGVAAGWLAFDPAEIAAMPIRGLTTA